VRINILSWNSEHQAVLQRGWERREMRRRMERHKFHTICCGANWSGGNLHISWHSQPSDVRYARDRNWQIGSGDTRSPRFNGM